MSEYQQGYDPNSLWDVGFFGTLWVMAKGLFVYVAAPIAVVWVFYKLFVE